MKFFNVYLFILRERDRVCVCAQTGEEQRKRERERERETQAGSTLSMQSPTQGLISQTTRSWPEPKLRVGHLTDWTTLPSSSLLPFFLLLSLLLSILPSFPPSFLFSLILFLSLSLSLLEGHISCKLIYGNSLNPTLKVNFQYLRHLRMSASSGLLAFFTCYFIFYFILIFMVKTLNMRSSLSTDGHMYATILLSICTMLHSRSLELIYLA